VTRVSSLGMFFVGWVLIAEFVIDRHGWDRWLPYYRVGNLCPYDALVVVVLAGAWVALHRRVKPAA
jgi:hypothetical protein